MMFLVKEPKPYGFYHFFCIVVVILLTIYLCKKYKNTDEKSFRKVILVGWLIMLLFEIIKQFYGSFDFASKTFKYNYSKFPLQFCSTPLYVMPIVAFSKNNTIQRAARNYLQSFTLLAGIMVFLVPNTVYSTDLFLDIQTMVHHGLQIIMGIFIASYNIENYDYKSFKEGTIVFLIFLLIAIILNVGLNKIEYIRINYNFNMFYVSPYDLPPANLSRWLYNNVSFPTYAILYLIGVTLFSFLLFLFEKKINEIKIDEVSNEGNLN